ncbi:hypothetical protein DFJ77DRAFT_265277 [Powellomyces hirtus]|nr:hypothetical protein DFJ77DRAFT_265277 [Powellomyces hirtus]
MLSMQSVTSLLGSGDSPALCGTRLSLSRGRTASLPGGGASLTGLCSVRSQLSLAAHRSIATLEKRKKKGRMKENRNSQSSPKSSSSETSGSENVLTSKTTRRVQTSMEEMNATRSAIHLYTKQKRVFASRAANCAADKKRCTGAKTASSSSHSSTGTAQLFPLQYASITPIGKTSSISSVNLEPPSPRVVLPRCATAGRARKPLRLAVTPMVETFEGLDADSLMGSLKNRRDLRKRLKEHAATVKEISAQEAMQVAQMLEREQRNASRNARLERRAEIICLNNILKHIEEQDWWRRSGGGCSDREKDQFIERNNAV